MAENQQNTQGQQGQNPSGQQAPSAQDPPANTPQTTPSSREAEGTQASSSQEQRSEKQDDGTAQAAGFGARGVDEVAKAKAVEKVNGPKVNAEQVKFHQERREAGQNEKDEDGVRRALPKSRVRTVDSDDPSAGWTAQHAVPRVEVEPTPGQVLAVEELPTALGLKEAGVADTALYLAGVPVAEDKDDGLFRERRDSRPGAHPGRDRPRV